MKRAFLSKCPSARLKKRRWGIMNLKAPWLRIRGAASLTCPRQMCYSVPGKNTIDLRHRKDQRRGRPCMYAGLRRVCWPLFSPFFYGFPHRLLQQKAPRRTMPCGHCRREVSPCLRRLIHAPRRGRSPRHPSMERRRPFPVGCRRPSPAACRLRRHCAAWRIPSRDRLWMPELTPDCIGYAVQTVSPSRLHRKERDHASCLDPYCSICSRAR